MQKECSACPEDVGDKWTQEWHSILPCGRYACVGTQGGILTWDLVEKKEGFIDTSHDHGVGEPVLGISYRYDGANIVSYDRKRKVAIWI